jgi:hypothetical protein
VPADGGGTRQKVTYAARLTFEGQLRQHNGEHVRAGARHSHLAQALQLR